jgi:hypothetical protein
LKRLNELLAEPGIQVLLFCLGMVLLNWPFLGSEALNRPVVLFRYFFFVWIALILILFLVARACKGSLNGDGGAGAGD